MPRKKTTGKETISAHTDDIFKSIIKDFGNVVFSGEEFLRKKKAVIPLPPSLAFAHNGGIQEGEVIVLSGQPRCGKTVTALHFAATAQQFGRQVIYMNAETRLEERDLRGIAGLRFEPEYLDIVQSREPEYDEHGRVVAPGKILTARDYLDIAGTFLRDTTRKVIILDSISVMLGDAEWNEGLDAVAIGEAQKLFSKFMRLAAPVVSTNKHIFIGIVHLYANISGGPGPKWLEKMSGSANYGLTSKFRAVKFNLWIEGTEKAVVGQEVKWKCERSPLGPPGMEVTSYIRYGLGIDEVKELIAHAVPLKLIAKSGSWYELTGSKLQGEENVCQYLNDHPRELATLRAAVYDGLGLSSANGPGNSSSGSSTPSSTSSPPPSR